MTQEKLAAYCDMDKGYVSQVESGKRLPSIPALVAFASELGVEVADIVGFNMSVPRLALLDAARRHDADMVRDALKRLGLRGSADDGGSR